MTEPGPLPPSACGDTDNVDGRDLLTSQSTYGDLESRVSFDEGS